MEELDLQQHTLGFEFLPPFVDETDNGLCFKDIYIPEEVLILILSQVPAKQLLRLSLVCKKWCNIIKSHALWALFYRRHYKKTAKKLPWYVFYCRFATEYFDRNLLKNGNGQEEYKHWKIIENGGNRFKIESEPVGAKPLPTDVADFNGYSSCFTTSYGNCRKLQEIYLGRSLLLQYIINKYTPTIVVSEWTTGRFDCSCIYRLTCQLLNKEMDINLHEDNIWQKFKQWTYPNWIEVQMELSEYTIAEKYSCEVNTIVFQHEGKDTSSGRDTTAAKWLAVLLRLCLIRLCLWWNLICD